MELEMTIQQGDNGWILKFCGHDYLDRTVICKRWPEVIRELNDYFGWLDMQGKETKIPQN